MIFKRKWSHRRYELEFARRWGDLSTYNTEKAHGIVHTPEWVARMEAKQALYNEISISSDRDVWTCEIPTK